MRSILNWTLSRAGDEKPRWMSLKCLHINESQQAGKRVPYRMNHTSI